MNGSVDNTDDIDDDDDDDKDVNLFVINAAWWLLFGLLFDFDVEDGFIEIDVDDDDDEDIDDSKAHFKITLSPILAEILCDVTKIDDDWPVNEQKKQKQEYFINQNI